MRKESTLAWAQIRREEEIDRFFPRSHFFIWQNIPCTGHLSLLLQIWVIRPLWITYSKGLTGVLYFQFNNSILLQDGLRSFCLVFPIIQSNRLRTTWRWPCQGSCSNTPSSFLCWRVDTPVSRPVEPGRKRRYEMLHFSAGGRILQSHVQWSQAGNKGMKCSILCW